MIIIIPRILLKIGGYIDGQGVEFFVQARGHEPSALPEQNFSIRLDWSRNSAHMHVR